MTSPVPDLDRKFVVLLPEDALELFNLYSKHLFTLGKLYSSVTDERILTSLSSIATGKQEVVNVWGLK